MRKLLVEACYAVAGVILLALITLFVLALVNGSDLPPDPGDCDPLIMSC